MIDIHNHIIPAIDDGSKSIDDSIQLIEQAVGQGITGIICTPHIHPGRYDNNLVSIKKSFFLLRDKVRIHKIPIAMGFAAEIRVSDQLVIDLDKNSLPFIGTWKGNPALLLEMSHAKVPIGMEELLSWLVQRGIQPIVAHPERNKELIKYPERVFSLVERGALLQVTAGSLVGEFGKKALEASEWLLDRQLVTFIASDAHHPKRRPPAMAPARQRLIDINGELLARKLTVDNPMQLTLPLFESDVCLVV